MNNNVNDNVEELPIFSIATDPIYIGTGGYTIGRVDNTIVRDPTTKIPKIPGSSVAGTWRYYVALELQSKIKGLQPDFSEIKTIDIEDSDDTSLNTKIKKWCDANKSRWEKKIDNKNDWVRYFGNVSSKITCAGQDNVSTASINSPDTTDKDGKTGHCGHCIVCKAFGYSKKDKSWQGMLLFSDLNILFSPVYTRLGVKWITSKRILEDASLQKDDIEEKEYLVVLESIEKSTDNNSINEGYINLGWLNLPYKVERIKIDLSQIQDIKDKDIVIIPDSLISQIINSNLEVRTSVSIDPITGTAKERALFTSEAIPRGTIFYGNIRLFDKQSLGDDNLPSAECIWEALDDTKKYYEVLGIGGMTTRGFGRMKILSNLSEKESSTTAS